MAIAGSSLSSRCVDVTVRSGRYAAARPSSSDSDGTRFFLVEPALINRRPADDFESGDDRIDATLPAGQTIESIATQQGDHLLLNFGAGGGQVWLAWTTLADLAGVDVLV